MSIKELAERAVDFITDREKDDDYICEQLCPEWCETHCIDTLRKECVVEFLTNYYEKNETTNGTTNTDKVCELVQGAIS